MKRILALVLAVAMVLSLAALTGCGKNTFELALITDVGNIDDKSFNEGAWNGVKEYAEANDISYAYYRPSGDTTAARLESIGAAVDKGAKIIVCPGFLFEDAIYEAQSQYPNVQFLLLDGEPHTADYATYRTDSNVHCILYKEEQAGYFAGYAIVKDGYTKLGFLGGMDVPAVIRFGFGFVQGANDAAKELGITVEIKYWYSSVFAANDDIKNKMDSWYSEGTQVVFSCGGGIYLSAVAAALAANGKVIGVDVDQSVESPLIITSAMKELTTSVKLALTSLYANNGKWDASHAGKTATLGAAENCVGLPTATASWRFATFTVAEYNTLFEAVKNGTVVVSNDIANRPAVTAATVDYQN